MNSPLGQPVVSDLAKQFIEALRFQQRVEQYSALVAATITRYSSDNDGQRWITVGGDKDADGHRHGGHPVLIGKDGTIHGGMGGKFDGKKLSEAFGGSKEPPTKAAEPASKPEPKPVMFRAKVGSANDGYKVGDRFEHKGQMHEVVKAEKPYRMTRQDVEHAEDMDDFGLTPGYYQHYHAKPVDKNEAEMKADSDKKAAEDSAKAKRDAAVKQFNDVAESSGMESSHTWPAGVPQPKWQEVHRENVRQGGYGDYYYVGEVDGQKVARKTSSAYDDHRESYYFPKSITESDVAKKAADKKKSEDQLDEVARNRRYEKDEAKEQELAKEHEQLALKFFNEYGELPHRSSRTSAMNKRAIYAGLETPGFIDEAVRQAGMHAAFDIAHKQASKEEKDAINRYIATGEGEEAVNAMRRKAKQIEDERASKVQELGKDLEPERLQDVLRSVRDYSFYTPEQAVENALEEQAEEAKKKAERKAAREAKASTAKSRPSLSSSRPASATWAKLKSGAWGARVDGSVKKGDSITITARDGRKQTKTVGKVVHDGDGYSLVEVYAASDQEQIEIQMYAQRQASVFAPLLVDQYARKQSQSPELFDDAGQAKWVTIGGEMGADGHRHGGHPVKIDSQGKMLTGAFAGQTMGQAFGKSEAKQPEQHKNAPEKPDSSKPVNSNATERNGVTPDEIKSLIPGLSVDPSEIRGTHVLFEDEIIEPREINNRRIAARARRQQLEREKAGMFANEVAAEQKDPKEELEEADSRMKERITATDTGAREKWLSNLNRLAQKSPEDQAKLVAAWNAAATPKDHAYFGDWLSKAEQRGLASKVTDRSDIADKELRSNVERMDKTWRTLKDIEKSANPDSPHNIAPKRLAEELAKYKSLGISPPAYESDKPSWEEIQKTKSAETEAKRLEAEKLKAEQAKELLFSPDELKPAIGLPVEKPKSFEPTLLGKPGITLDTRANEAAKTGDQMGLFGDVANVPSGKAKLDQVGTTKGHQMAMFDTKGDPDQMLMFDDGVTPEDRLMPEAKTPKPFEPTILGSDSLKKSGDDAGPIPFRERKEFAAKLAAKGKLHSEIVDAMMARGVAASDARRHSAEALGDKSQSKPPEPEVKSPEQPAKSPELETKSPEPAPKPVELDEPATPSEKAVDLFGSDIAKGESPRSAAAAAQKKLDEDYEFARTSNVRNAGEDLKGSARHKVNRWKNLEDAEKNGTAAELITRDQLLKNEPHNLFVHADRNPLTALAMHYALKAFPAKPGTGKRGDFEKDRKQYLEAYQSVRAKAEELAKTRDSGDVVKAIGEMQSHVLGLIKQLRGQKSDDSIGRATATDMYNQTANDLVNLHKALATNWRANKTGVAGRTNDFGQAAKERYGDLSVENIAEHAKDVMEGKSLNVTFGREKKSSDRFDPSEMYVKIATRTGGRDLSSVTSDANKATKHMVESMGLRGIQWGNSVTDDERKHHAAKAVEALTDLADTLGLHPKDIALDGKLGLAIGARGRGGAVAHYEPDSQVINLTRASGVGSLAHEWAHGFDHALNDYNSSRFMSDDTDTHTIKQKNDKLNWQGTTSDPEHMTKMGYIATERSKSGVRKAMANLAKAQKEYRNRLYKFVNDNVSGSKQQSYWRSEKEIFARTFERYVQHKLELSDKKNTYLAGIETKGHKFDGFWPTDDEVKAMAPAFDKLFEEYRKHKHGSADPVKYSRAEAVSAFTPLLIDRYFAKKKSVSADDLWLDEESVVDRYEWVESNHPRNPAGSAGGIGGQFRSTKLRELPDTDTVRGVDKSHDFHHSKLPPDLQKQALNWSAELHRLVGQPMNTNYDEQLAKDAGRPMTPEQVQQLKEQRWKSVDKNEVRKLLDQMNQMDKQAKTHGIDLASHINASRLIPPELAMRLSGGRRFFDPTKMKAKAAPSQSSQQQTQQQPESKRWQDDPAKMAEYERRKGLTPSQPKSVDPNRVVPGTVVQNKNRPNHIINENLASHINGEKKAIAATPEPEQSSFSPTHGLSSQAAGKVDRAAADTVGDGDQSKVDHFKGLIMDAWKLARDQAQEHNAALNTLQNLAGGSTFAARLSQHLARGGDVASVEGFDTVVDHARRHFPHLVGGADDAESGVVDMFRKGIQQVPQPWHDDVIDQAVQMAPQGFFDEYVPSAANAPDDEPVPFSVVADCRHFVQCYWLTAIKDIYALRNHPMHAAAPTEAQKEAGNYRMSHIKFQGIDITIETPKGRSRRPEWPTMKAHYGYFKRTTGADDENIDCFVGPDKNADTVYIVDQVKPNGQFDEHKCLIGFPTREAAIAAYRGSYSIGWRVGKVTVMTMDGFKKWLKSEESCKPAAAC